MKEDMTFNKYLLSTNSLNLKLIKYILISEYLLYGRLNPVKKYKNLNFFKVTLF